MTNKGYPADIQALSYDASLGIRGLVVDHEAATSSSPTATASPGAPATGSRRSPAREVAALYQRERMRLADPRYAWIDSLFALPEAVLYASLVDYFDRCGRRPSPTTPSCGATSASASTWPTATARSRRWWPPTCPSTSSATRPWPRPCTSFRSSGKRLFLLTNSAWDYTDPVMSYLLDGALPAYPSWRNFFDIIIVSGAKPAFFTEEHPFVELDPRRRAAARKPSRGPLRARPGLLRRQPARLRGAGPGPRRRVLYIGDHIYGDMLRSRKSSAWRTAMVLQELEHEVEIHDRMTPELLRLDDLERQLRHLDAEISDKQMVLRALQRREGSDGLPRWRRPTSTPAKRAVKETLDRMRGASCAPAWQDHRGLEETLDAAFNPHWGPMFREGYEISKFGEQVEAYACVYTSRVSNFRFYSPMQYFRGPRDRMPHER